MSGSVAEGTLVVSGRRGGESAQGRCACIR